MSLKKEKTTTKQLYSPKGIKYVHGEDERWANLKKNKIFIEKSWITWNRFPFDDQQIIQFEIIFL